LASETISDIGLGLDFKTLTAEFIRGFLPLPQNFPVKSSKSSDYKYMENKLTLSRNKERYRAAEVIGSENCHQ